MRLRFLLAALLFLAPPASAYWQSRDSAYDQSIVAFQGPGDVKSGALAWGSCARAYTLAFALTGAAICDVVDTSTGLTTCTFHIQSTGFVNPSECNATACATACSVTKVYDQTGNTTGWTNATLATMPGLTFSALNGLPALSCVRGSNTVLAGATNISQAMPYTYYMVAKRTASGAGASAVIGAATTTNAHLGYDTTANTALLANQTNLTAAGATDNSWFVISALAASGATASIINITGVDGAGGNSGGVNVYSTTPQPLRICRGGGAVPGSTTGLVAEVGMWASTSTTDRTNLYNNAHGANGYNGGV